MQSLLWLEASCALQELPSLFKQGHSKTSNLKYFGQEEFEFLHVWGLSLFIHARERDQQSLEYCALCSIVLYRINRASPTDACVRARKKESCKLVGATQRIVAATESHLIPNLLAQGFKAGDCENQVKNWLAIWEYFFLSFCFCFFHKICTSQTRWSIGCRCTTLEGFLIWSLILSSRRKENNSMWRYEEIIKDLASLK